MLKMDILTLGNDYKVGSLSNLYLTVTGIIILCFK